MDKIEWLNSKKAAEFLGITTRTLYRFVDGGGLPAYKMGRVLRFQKPDLELFLSGARVKSGDLYILPKKK